MPAVKPITQNDPRPSIVAAFVDLIDAHFRTLDHRKAAEALDSLRQLGVEVRFPQKPPRKRRGAKA